MVSELTVLIAYFPPYSDSLNQSLFSRDRQVSLQIMETLINRKIRI
jgi:hypothetical protein